MAYDNCLRVSEECKQETKRKTFENAVGSKHCRRMGLEKGEGRGSLLISTGSAGKHGGVKKEEMYPMQLGDELDLH